MSNQIQADRPLVIGDKTAKYPVIQGGMGVGVSRSMLAGAVAAAGGIGIISTAQIGYDEKDFATDTAACNLRAIQYHIEEARRMATAEDGTCPGLIGVNVMTALKHYKDHVRVAAQAGADVIICGAGLALDLPQLVEGSNAKIAPIVSSARACKVLLRQWSKQYERTADFLVFEGPAAGGHLGFHQPQLEEFGFSCGESASQSVGRTFHLYMMDEEIRKVIECKAEYEEKYGVKIPLVVAGGVFDHQDVLHMLALGADGVQLASRFVATYECDASDAYKQAYVQAKEEDVCIIKSPVGLPGRALNNAFVKRTKEGKIPVKRCFQCLAKCNPAQVPYCITKALIDAVKGDVEQGLVFCGSNIGRIKKLVHVDELIRELVYG